MSLIKHISHTGNGGNGALSLSTCSSGKPTTVATGPEVAMVGLMEVQTESEQERRVDDTESGSGERPGRRAGCENGLVTRQGFQDRDIYGCSTEENHRLGESKRLKPKENLGTKLVVEASSRDKLMSSK